MPSPTLFAINADRYFIQELQRRLSPHGISVELSTLTELPYLFNPRFRGDCALINVDLSNIQQLLSEKILENANGQPRPEIVVLVPDDSLYCLVKNRVNHNIAILNANILMDKLVSLVLEKLPGTCTRDGDLEYFNGINGYLHDVSLPKLIAFFKQSAFTGRVFVEIKEGREGVLRFNKGVLHQITCNSLPEGAALREMVVNGHRYRVEQHLLSNNSIASHLKNSIEGELSLNDLLIDLFYFMHEEFERVVDLSVIRQTVDTILQRYINWEKDGVYFIYNPRWQEKLQIIGEVNQYQVSTILEMYEAIFEELSVKTHLRSFDDFVKSLDEIKPYMLQIQPLQPIITDDPVMTL